MTKEELFEKYNINETHKARLPYDNFMSVELYRVMHDGNLPSQNDTSVTWIIDFLDKTKNIEYVVKMRKERDDFGSLYLTAKRLVYSLWEQIIKEL